MCVTDLVEETVACLVREWPEPEFGPSGRVQVIGDDAARKRRCRSRLGDYDRERRCAGSVACALAWQRERVTDGTSHERDDAAHERRRANRPMICHSAQKGLWTGLLS